MFLVYYLANHNLLYLLLFATYFLVNLFAPLCLV